MKKIYIALLSSIIIAAVSLILIICFKGDNKPKKDNKSNDSETKIETKYTVNDLTIGDLDIKNINVELFDDYTLVDFRIKNNSTEVYPGGNIVFNIEDSNVILETVSSVISTIEPDQFVNVSLVLDDVYPSIDAIKIDK